MSTKNGIRSGDVYMFDAALVMGYGDVHETVGAMVHLEGSTCGTAESTVQR